jgi:drug/metabolite transporter (DMT)-like permease
VTRSSDASAARPPAGTSDAAGAAPSDGAAPTDDAAQSRVGAGALVWVALGVVYLVWGSTYLGIRIVVRTLPALGAMGVRFGVAGLIMAAIVRLAAGSHVWRVQGRQVASAALVGVLLLACGNGGVAVAEKTVPSGLAALLVAAMPLWLVLLRTAARDRPRPLSLVGTLVGFVGIAVLARPVTGPAAVAQAAVGHAAVGHAAVAHVSTGTLIVLAGTLCWATGTFLSPRLPMPDSPFVATSIEMLAGAAVMLVASPLIGELHGFSLSRVQPSAWWALAYLVGVGSLLGFTAFVWLARNAPLSLVSTYAYVNPVVAVFLGWLLLAERVTAAIVAGGALAITGVFLVIRSERAGRPGRTRPAAVTEDAAAPAQTANTASGPGVVDVDGTAQDLTHGRSAR